MSLRQNVHQVVKFLTYLYLSLIFRSQIDTVSPTSLLLGWLNPKCSDNCSFHSHLEIKQAFLKEDFAPLNTSILTDIILPIVNVSHLLLPCDKL